MIYEIYIDGVRWAVNGLEQGGATLASFALAAIAVFFLVRLAWAMWDVRRESKTIREKVGTVTLIQNLPAGF